MHQQSAQSAIQAGLDALRRGDAREARERLEAIAEEGGSLPWLALARACNLLGDSAAEEEALKRQLELDKRDLTALLAMGELKAKQGDRRSASAFFKTALNVASLGAAPPQLQPLIQRAAAFLEECRRQFEVHMTEKLALAGLGNGSASPRLRQALDLLLGRTQLYLQQPNMFYYPGLPQRQFYEREEFDWVPELEAQFPALLQELVEVIASEGEFAPYVAGSPDRPSPNNRLLNDPSWGAYYLWQAGLPVEDHAQHCRRTMAALESVPMPVVSGRSPVALYSLLKPGTHITPHHGMLNTRLICHLPLIVPENCAIRVGCETRRWEEGRILIFDDSFEHEAWNRSDRNRIVLIFEIWRPELSERERAELTTLFEAIELMPTGESPDA